MHGRKKISIPLSVSEIEKVQKKIQTFTSLVTILFERKQLNDYSIETLKLTTKLLASNPDLYSMWNYRREILISLHSESLGLTNENISKVKIIADNIRDEELNLTVEAIKRNSKSCKQIFFTLLFPSYIYFFIH